MVRSSFSFLSFLSLFLLTSCLLVDDFSSQWNKGKADRCISKIAESLYYTEFRRDPAGKDINQLARSFTLGKYHFLMLKQGKEDAGGRMYRFGVINGIFQRYRLNPAMKATFMTDYPNAPVDLSHDTVRLSKLTEQEMKLLEEISNKADYWEIEDQTLYNALRDPECIYEDRDLKALEAKKPRK